MNDHHPDYRGSIPQETRNRCGIVSLLIGGISVILPYLLLGVALLVALILRMGNLRVALLMGFAVGCIITSCVAVAMGMIALNQTRALPNKRAARRDAWTGIWAGVIGMLQGTLIFAIVIGLASIPPGAAS